MATIDKIRLSGQTYDIIDATAIHSLDGYATTGYVQSATSALAESFEEVISGKADSSAVTQEISAAVSGKADASDVITDIYTSDVSSNALGVFRTKNGSDSKFLQLSGGTGIQIWSQTGAADIYQNIRVDTDVIAQKTDIPSVSGYADSVKYDTNSKEMKFYHGGTGGTEVFSFDASPFLIDGMVQNVEIKDVTISGESVTCLVISFNTDAGKQDINIPISQIFDASNYYTTAQTDNKIAEATSGKADSSDVETLSGTVTAHTADTTIHVTSSEKNTWNGKQNALTAGTGIQISGDVISVTGAPLTMDDHLDSGSTNPVMNSAITVAIDAKQEKLVSGTNIKTVGTESILGSGNIKLMTASIGTGNDSTTLIFDFN